MMNAQTLVETAQKYKQCFKQNGIDVQIIPLRPDNKNPIVKHKGGVYDENKFIYKPKCWVTKNGEFNNFGWLMNEQLFCIDLDGVADKKLPKDEWIQQKRDSADQYYQMFEEKFDLTGAWIEKTSKGYHIIWKKPTELQDLTLAIDAFKDADLPGIDIVTITKSVHNDIASKSILAVYPSNGKKWLDGHNPLNGDAVFEPPTELVSWIKENIRKTKETNKKQNKLKKISVQIKKKVQAHGTELEIKELKAILAELPDKYYEDTNNGGDWKLWHKVMLGIQYLMGESGYQTWAAFNKRASCWSAETEVTNKRRYWDENIGVYVDNPIRMGSFRFWLKQDNPDAWKILKKESLFNQQLTALNGDIYQLGQLAALELPSVMLNKVTGRWCKFEDGVWDTDYRGLVVDINEVVKKNLQDTLLSYFKRQKVKITVEDLENNPNAKKEIEAKIQKVKKFVIKISNQSDKIVRQMQSICCRKLDFDENPWLLGFKGGYLYDFKAKAFRIAEMEDMVTMSCGVTADQVLSVSSDDLEEIQDFIETILPDQDARDYQLYLDALALNGIEAKKFIAQLGSGANGKSSKFGLIKAAFGDYCKNVSTAHYTSPFKESGPRPDLLDFQGTRMFIATEPSEGERFNTGAIKKITGGDPIRCRGMWQGNTMEFSVVGQHNILCNVKLAMDGVDGGIKRRFVNINYPVKFCHSPDPNNPLEKPINAKFKSESWYKKMSPALMNWLLELHDFYLDQGLAEYEMQTPKCVVDVTDNWVNDSIPIRGFMDEHYEPDTNEDKSNRIKFKDIITRFRQSRYYLQLSKREQRYWNVNKNCLEKLVENCPEWCSVYHTYDKVKSFYAINLNPDEDNVPNVRL